MAKNWKRDASPQLDAGSLVRPPLEVAPVEDNADERAETEANGLDGDVEFLGATGGSDGGDFEGVEAAASTPLLRIGDDEREWAKNVARDITGVGPRLARQAVREANRQPEPDGDCEYQEAHAGEAGLNVAEITAEINIDALDALTGIEQGGQLLLSKLDEPGKLSELLRDWMPTLMSDGEWSRTTRRVYTRRVGAQEARSGSQLVARCITKQLDAGLVSELRHCSMEARSQVCRRLAEWSCYRLLEAIVALAQYGKLTGEFEMLRAEWTGKRVPNEVGGRLSFLRCERERLRLCFQERLWLAYLETCGGEAEGR